MGILIFKNFIRGGIFVRYTVGIRGLRLRSGIIVELNFRGGRPRAIVHQVFHGTFPYLDLCLKD